MFVLGSTAQPFLFAQVYTCGGLIWDSPLIIFTISISNMLLFALYHTLTPYRSLLLEDVTIFCQETGLSHHPQNYPSTPSLYSSPGTVHLTLKVKSLGSLRRAVHRNSGSEATLLALGYKSFARKPKCEAGATRSRLMTMVQLTDAPGPLV